MASRTRKPAQAGKRRPRASVEAAPRRRRKSARSASAGAETVEMPDRDGFVPPADAASDAPAPGMDSGQAEDAAEGILGANPLIGLIDFGADTTYTNEDVSFTFVSGLLRLKLPA